MTEEEKRESRQRTIRKYYQTNREKILDLFRERYKKNKGSILARNKAWAAANPERIRALSLEGTNRRKARMLGADGSHTEQQWLELVEFCGGRCVCCGEAKPLTKDHIVPLTSGGSDNIENLQPLCRECNSSKRTQTINYLAGAVLQ